ncbi:hypothetical protein ACFPK9_01515 [Rubritalea spongiae]|uniref:YARHG domain-containing protein n=2 Tax=Rubritalea spongiae TaxID=430797 RepID=A0ABW5E289_9BACT
MHSLSAKALVVVSSVFMSVGLTNCASTSASSGSSGSLGGRDISPEQRQLEILTEPTGDFYYGRRYFVSKTRFWGYVRKPRQPWSEAKLVMMNESVRPQPDRLPESGPSNARHGYDQNYDYKITGSYTGRKVYDPASNLFLPEFKASGYQVLDRQPGWLFSPKDTYDPHKITLVNKHVGLPTR